MALAAASLIPELEDVVQHGSAERRAEALQRITTLFLTGADRFSDEHVQLFDDVLGQLIVEIESKARAELSRRLAPIGNAPPDVLRSLAHDDDIAVAGPVLTQSVRLEELDLVAIARTKSQAHLLAIATRKSIGEKVTDVLVARGERDVIHNVAGNGGAKLSNEGFTALVKRSENDGALAEKVGARPDIPPRLFRDLLMKATEVVQERLLASAKPSTQAEIRRVLAHVSSELDKAVPKADYGPATRIVDALRKDGKLNEDALVDFAKANKFEETVVALASLCGVPVDVVDRLMSGDRPDPILILCKATGWGWQTAKSIMTVRPGAKGTSSQGLDAAFTNFERLSPATAQRVLRFWQVRAPDAKAG